MSAATRSCCAAATGPFCSAFSWIRYQQQPNLAPLSVEGPRQLQISALIVGGCQTTESCDGKAAPYLVIEDPFSFSMRVSCSCQIASVWLRAELPELLQSQEQFLENFAFRDLPLPVLSRVLLLLPLDDAARLARVSKRCHAAFNDETSWKWRLKCFLKHVPIPAMNVSCKQTFKEQLDACLDQAEASHGSTLVPVVYWKDIALPVPEDAKCFLQNVVLQSLVCEKMESVANFFTGGVLLYGPVGTGKTMLSHALALEREACFFNFCMAKFYKDPAKVLRDCFESARSRAPSIILIDDIDLMCRESSACVQARAELCSQMDQVAAKNQHVIVLAASNCPWEIAESLVRRFEKRIFVPLPDLRARETIFEKEAKCTNLATDVNFRTLAGLTEGYSGSDIRVLSGSSFLLAWRQCMTRGDRSGTSVSLADYTCSLTRMNPSNSVDYMHQLEAWRDEH